MKIACIQMDSQESTETNLKEMKQWIDQASDADYIFFPEAVDYCGNDFDRHAYPIPGLVSNQFANFAKEANAYLYAGSIAEKTNGMPKNTSLFFNPEGKIIGRYSKTHLFDIDLDQQSYRESSWMQAGDSYSVVETKDTIFGMSICYDLRFPIMYQKMAQAGAKILVVVANFTKPTGQAHWHALLRARAIENTAYVIATNQVGTKESLHMEAYGHTMIIDPWGKIIAEADGNSAQIVWADIDLEKVEKVRKKIPCLKNEREDLPVHEFMLQLKTR